MYFIAPAGSNVAYISRIFKKEKNMPSGLAYHELGGQWTHDLDYSKIDNKCVKIFFPHDYQIIVLNWFYKIFVYPTGAPMQSEGKKEWIDSQKNIWKNYGDKWKVKAFCRWVYNIANNKSYGSKIEPPGNNFSGVALYNCYSDIKDEFGKFNIDYSKQSHDSWLKSQYIILKSLDAVRNSTTISHIHNLTNDCEKGVSIALYGLKHHMSEDDVWDSYTK